MGTAVLAVDSDAPASNVAAASAASAASSARPDGDAGSKLDLLDDDASAWRSKLTRARLKCHTGRRRDRSRNSLRVPSGPSPSRRSNAASVDREHVLGTWQCVSVLEVQATVGDGPSSKLGVFELVVDVPCGGRVSVISGPSGSAVATSQTQRGDQLTELELRQANVILNGANLGLAVDVLHVVHDPGGCQGSRVHSCV